MQCSIQIVTPFTSFAYDLKAQLQSLGYLVSLNFDVPLRCRILYQDRQLEDEEDLFKEIQVLKLNQYPNPEDTQYQFMIELGGLDLLSRLAQCSISIQGSSIDSCQELERTLEPIGFRQLKVRRAQPHQALLRYGGAPHAILAMISWYALRQGWMLDWARVWALNEMDLMITLPKVPSLNTVDREDPSQWKITIESDDHDFADLLAQRLLQVGFQDFKINLEPLPSLIGVQVSWGPISPSEGIKMSLWSALSEVERQTFGSHTSLSRCELTDDSMSLVPLLDQKLFTPTLTPSLIISISCQSANPHFKTTRTRNLIQSLEFCIRTERGELGEVARWIRSLKPQRLNIVTQKEWEELCECMLLVHEHTDSPDLPQHGLVWGEIRCGRSLASLGAWLRDEIERLTQRRPLLEISPALSAQEIWILLPKGQ